MNKEYSITIDKENFQQRPMWTNCKQLKKNWTMFTQMSQPFTSIYNELFSLGPKPCPNIVLSLSSSKKE